MSIVLTLEHLTHQDAVTGRQAAESAKQGLQRDLEFEKTHSVHVEEVCVLDILLYCNLVLE